MKKPNVFKGDFYFPTRGDAVEWATANGWPTDFVRSYGRGFAVQACNSGRYAGPDQTWWCGPDWQDPWPKDKAGV
jgi:hypothetical protein